MTDEELAALLIVELKAATTLGSYINADGDDLSDVLIDGYYDMVAVARNIRKALEK